MSNVYINVDRRTDGWTGGRTENRTPISHPATSRCDKKWGLRGSKLYRHVFVMIKLFVSHPAVFQTHQEVHVANGLVQILGQVRFRVNVSQLVGFLNSCTLQKNMTLAS